MGSDHPLLGAEVLAAIERAATAHRGRPWVSQGFTSLDDLVQSIDALRFGRRATSDE